MRPPAALAIALLLTPALTAQTLRVDATLTTGANDGSSWANAFQGSQGLHDALAAAPAGAEVWLAAGVYLPSDSLDPRACFEVLADDVVLRGGFAGFESTPFERPGIGGARTILSGDLAGDDDASLTAGADNSDVVVHVGAERIALDRLELVGGGVGPGVGAPQPGAALLLGAGARGIRMTDCRVERCYEFGVIAAAFGPAFEVFVSGCTFRDVAAVGLYALSFDSPVEVERCTFERCDIAFFLGERWLDGSRLRSSVVRACRVGLVFHVDAFAQVIAYVDGCTIVDNVQAGVSQSIAGMGVPPLGVVVRNSILAGNNGAFPADGQVSSYVFPEHSLVEGGGFGPTVLDADPMFVDRAGGDLRLLAGSPAIDRGTAAGYADGDLDLDGRHRAVDVASVPNEGAGTPDFIDLGAYEFTGSIGDNLGCSAQPNSTGLRGRLLARGSVTAAANDLTIVGEHLPAGQFSMFLASWQQGFVPMAGGPGTLCLGGAIGRFNRPGEIQAIGPAGSVALAVDLASLPQPTSLVAAQPGETWRFQLWHMDLDPSGSTTNRFTGVVAVRLE
ncbi:MAG: right-handed parallel beta-helix repeat-containing protein [Planctomycetota bacterium]